VLLVEDDPDIRSSLEEILRLDGHDVRSAGTGPDALAAIEAAVPDVAVIDIGLPGMSGYDLARTIRARWQTAAPRLVALTGYGQPLDRAAAEAAGFAHHLTKPPDLSQFAAALRGKPLGT
jgi:CheY-like chemotaxis protein